MKIVSKFKDYYDSAMGYGIDPNCMYIREIDEYQKTKYVESSKDFSDREKLVSRLIGFVHDVPSSRFSRSPIVDTKVKEAGGVLFCGKLYPFVRFQTEYGVPDIDVTCYSADDIDMFVKKHGSAKRYEQFLKKESPKFRRRFFTPFGGGMTKQNAERFFNSNTTQREDEIIAIHQECKIPVIKISDTTVVFNPVLKDIEFFRVMDPFNAFQELSMFVSGILGGHSPEMVSISDEDRIHKHGFDEWSFRKHKDDNK